MGNFCDWWILVVVHYLLCVFLSSTLGAPDFLVCVWILTLLVVYTVKWRGWCILWTKDRYQCIWCIEQKISVCNITGIWWSLCFSCTSCYFVVFCFRLTRSFEKYCVCSLIFSSLLALSCITQQRVKKERGRHRLWYTELF